MIWTGLALFIIGVAVAAYMLGFIVSDPITIREKAGPWLVLASFVSIFLGVILMLIAAFT